MTRRGRRPIVPITDPFPGMPIKDRLWVFGAVVVSVATVVGVLADIRSDMTAITTRINKHGEEIRMLRNAMIRRLETEAGIDSPTASMED